MCYVRCTRVFHDRLSPLLLPFPFPSSHAFNNHAHPSISPFPPSLSLCSPVCSYVCLFVRSFVPSSFAVSLAPSISVSLHFIFIFHNQGVHRSSFFSFSFYLILFRVFFCLSTSPSHILLSSFLHVLPSFLPLFLL